MEDIDSSPAQSPNTRKRARPDEDSPQKKPLNLKGSQFVMPTPPDTDHSSNVSANNDDTSRPASPAPSSSALSSVEVVNDNEPQASSNISAMLASSTTSTTASGQPSAKRRKLTPSEKLQKQQEKDAKATEKAELKAQKEEEKKAKDKEKRQKAEERDEQKRIKDEEKRKKAEERDQKKREKEMEEERKAQEKLKKERSQMRLGAFFQKPATPVKQDESGAPIAGSARRRSLSLEQFDSVADEIRRSQSPMKGARSVCHGDAALTSAPRASNAKFHLTFSQTSKVQPGQQPPPSVAKETLPDYHRYFLPYRLPANAELAFQPRPGISEEDQEGFDKELTDPSIREKYDLGLVESYASLERHFAHERRFVRGFHTAPVKKVIEQIHGSFQQPIDLTSDQEPVNPMDALQDVSQRYLEFSEDVRPAYFGTYSRVYSPQTTRKLSRNPYTRARTDTDYDYDSEAEWEEPEEGEDLKDEDDDEDDIAGDAGEMDEFLDDEEDALKHKRKQITSDLVPTSTGLCWADTAGKIMPSIEGGTPSQAMKGMRMGLLLAGFTGTTIDPFSTAYWQNEPVKDSKPTLAAQPSASQVHGFLAPPRPPLQARASGNGTLDTMLVGAAMGEKGPITSVASTQGSKPGRKPAPKALSTEDMEEFKDAVVSSPLSKAELLKGLKARYIILQACPTTAK